jgi:hypothetical protein
LNQPDLASELRGLDHLWHHKLLQISHNAIGQNSKG